MIIKLKQKNSKSAIIVFMPGFESESNKIRKLLLGRGIKVITYNRNYLKKILHADLVLTIGGDGTYLKTSHFIVDETPVLGVNPDPKNKEGFFTSATMTDIDRKLSLFFDGKAKRIKLNRLCASINSKQLNHLALNEFYFGRKTGYHTSRYELSLGKRKEKQKGSGVLVGTPQGSYSWISSAGGKKMPLSSKDYQFVVREPYHAKLIKFNILGGLLKANQSISFRPLTKDFILVVDSLKEYPLKPNDRITIQMSKKPLVYIKY